MVFVVLAIVLLVNALSLWFIRHEEKELKITRIVLTSICIIIVTVGLYNLLPALSINNSPMWTAVGVFVLGIGAITSYFAKENAFSVNPRNRPYYERSTWGEEQKEEMEAKYNKYLKKEKLGNALKWTGAIIIALGFVLSFASSRLFNAQAYRDLANVEEGNFEEDFPEVNVAGSNIAFVSMGIAQRLGDRTIASVEGAEFYEVDDEYNLIEYQGDYYRISSLNYGGLLKWNSAHDKGIPGYVLVNARTQVAKFCYVDGGYFYSPSAHFEENLKRHLRMQYPSTIFDSKSYFEIDEEGHPYWITPVITKTILIFGGDKVNSVIITDAVNGNSEQYNVEDLPKWVDHAMLHSYLRQKAEDYYSLVHGAFNFSNADVKEVSYGYNSFVNKKGEVCFTMGLTPANYAMSNVGFILINSRTGQIKQYTVDGIQEVTAQVRAETLVQNYGYNATFPQVINVEGTPTYLMCLTGGDGLIQDIALACISTSSNATAYAPTLSEAITKYKAALEGNYVETANVNLPEQSGDEEALAEPIMTEEGTETASGIIKSIDRADIKGTTYFFYTLEGDEHLYKASILLDERQILLSEGDSIELGYAKEADVITAYKVRLN